MEFSLVTSSRVVKPLMGNTMRSILTKKQKKKKKKKKQKTKKNTKRLELLTADPIILHDNATPHDMNRVTSLLGRYEWETLDPTPPPPPAFSTELKTDLFPKLKGYMTGIRYNYLEELESAVAA